jgi:fused signal recognition particle receptor
MFSFIKNKLQQIFHHVTSKLSSLFGQTHVDTATLKELEILLLSSDVGVKTTRSIIDELQNQIGKTVTNGTQLKAALHDILLKIISLNPLNLENKAIFLFVGINGSGKTTSIGKLAQSYMEQGKKVLLVAADTFRAAAAEQLTVWAHKIGVDIICGKEGQDPASLVFEGTQAFKKNNYDILIVDTAGRLQTKINLMNELAKIKRTLTKQLPHNTITTLLTIDAMLGQNSFEQAKLFKESTDVDGIILTKMDGTGKGGIVFAIAQELAIPVVFLTFGEQSDQIKLFNPQEYVTQLLG